MKLYIKQNLFTLGEKFYVKDEDGNNLYYVEGSFLRIPKKFKIYNMNKQVVATIESRLFKIMSHYDIKTSKRELTVKENFTFIKKSLSILGSDWILQGNLTAHEYSVLNDNEPVMNLSKKWLTWGDTYELDILNKEDALVCLAIAIIVDNVLMKSASAQTATM